ncbi:MAG: NAD(P)-binding domain-containing protein [Deltaproteobacteria bacterium]|nr:NAD(P)-binding domain-containing protein [Deltaproteobacteria bacterium]
MKKVAVLGSGQVGEVLGNGFLQHGYAVMRASREPAKLAGWKSAAKGEAHTGTFADAAKWGDIIVLAVKGAAAEAALDQAGLANLANKTVIDATNPIADAPPQNGVIVYFTNANESLMERLQKKAPQAKFVKAFNSVGSGFMVNPKFPTPPSMFICGNDAGAKTETTEILGKFGWETIDMGPMEAARPIEALCQLWCLPGFLRNDWAHAFKYMKPA